jgi:hypothetical protein
VTPGQLGGRLSLTRKTSEVARSNIPLQGDIIGFLNVLLIKDALSPVRC